MLLRKIQGDEVQGDDLRSLWCKDYPQSGATEADGAYRTRRPDRPYLVFQGDAESDWQFPCDEDDQSRKSCLLPGLCRHRCGRYTVKKTATPNRRRIPHRLKRLWRGFF